jgi:K+-sensing histidine kinase KdpD
MAWRAVFGRSGGAPDAVGEFHFCRPDGLVRWIRYATRPIEDEGLVVAAHDVTAEVVAERIRGDLIARFAHDLRAPLTPLKGYLTMLAEDRIDLEGPDRGEVYDLLLRQVGRVEELLSKLEAGERRPQIVLVEDTATAH